MVNAPERASLYSIRGRLLAWLLGALVVAGLMMGYAAYRRAHQDLDELLDYQLQQLAFSLSRQSVANVPVTLNAPAKSPLAATKFKSDPLIVTFSMRDVPFLTA